MSAQVVQVRQEIQIARELRDNSCLFEAFLQHYRQRAEAARLALSDVAAGLPTALRLKVARVVAPYPDDTDLKNRIEAQLGVRLDDAVAKFSAMNATLRDQVDTPAEVNRLQTACGTS